MDSLGYQYLFFPMRLALYKGPYWGFCIELITLDTVDDCYSLFKIEKLPYHQTKRWYFDFLFFFESLMLKIKNKRDSMFPPDNDEIDMY